MPIRRFISIFIALLLMPAAWAGAPQPMPLDATKSPHAVRLRYRDEYRSTRNTAQAMERGGWLAIEPRDARK